MVEQICAKHKRPLIRINLNMMTDEEQLIGSKTLEDGNVEIVEGPVLIAMRNGTTLLLDEIDAGSANTLLCLQPILEGKPYYFAQSGEYIYPAPGFNVIATANTKGKGSDDGRYMGTNVLNDAFLERFGETYAQEFPAPAIEKKMVLNWMRRHNYEDEAFAEDLVKWADAIRRTFADGATDELISSRRLEHIVKSYSIFKNKKRCIERCTERFDNLTANAFRELFDKIAAEEISVPIEPVPNAVL
jgi:MoxR-like ATPase